MCTQHSKNPDKCIANKRSKTSKTEIKSAYIYIKPPTNEDVIKNIKSEYIIVDKCGKCGGSFKIRKDLIRKSYDRETSKYAKCPYCSDEQSIK